MRKSTAQKRQKRWQRRRGDYMVKSAKLTDGELLQLMLKPKSDVSQDIDERYYKSFQEVRGTSAKSMLWIIGAAAFGILSHFGAVKSARASGLEVMPAVFSHTALLALSFATAAFCFSYSKQTFIQSWFLAKMRNATASVKADCLLRYPEAYLIFHFLPAAIGYPKNILGPRVGWGQFLYLILILLVLGTFAVGSIWLWATIAIDVWRSPYQNHAVSILVIILSAAVALLDWSSPFYYEWPRRYRHMGLVNLLSKLKGPELHEAHIRIFLAASRMGLVDTDTLKDD